MIRRRKKCCICNELKTLVSFARSNQRKDKHQAHCKACARRMTRADYHKHKEKYNENNRWKNEHLTEVINAAKDRPCADCGRKYPPYVMDFDHLDRDSKIAPISFMKRRRYALTVIETEIAKCEVVCSNCHRERTYQRQKSGRIVS